MNETAAADAAVTDGGGEAAGGTDDAGAAADGDTPPAVVARDVRKAYGDVVALDGAELTVEAGEVFGLIGPNGAGKTTLVRALTGTTEIEGEVSVFGAAPDAVDPARIGLLPQSFGPPDRLTARELVDYYGGLYDEARDTDAVLDDVGLADDADAWYETLSGGQKRRACVATALVNDPDLLFLDEPTTGIDPAGRRSLHRLIEGLAASGTTVFLTSHAMDEVERLADRVALLRDGAVVAVGDPDALVDEHGGDPRLEVTLDAALDDSTLDAVREAASVEVTTTEGGIRFADIRPEGIADAVSALEAAGVTFESLTWTEPSMEDVYLRLTGETYSPRGDDETVGIGAPDTEEEHDR
ncbi:ABC transporter ATP-binding protein [Halorubrum gandharaense]